MIMPRRVLARHGASVGGAGREWVELASVVMEVLAFLAGYGG